MIAVVGAYIKRYGNLFLIRGGKETAKIKELERCIDESVINLELLGVSCGYDIPSGLIVYFDDIIRTYEIFEKIIENSLESIYSLWLKVRSDDESIVFHLEIECNEEKSAFDGLADRFSEEDGAYVFTIFLRKGDERV